MPQRPNRWLNRFFGQKKPKRSSGAKRTRGTRDKYTTWAILVPFGLLGIVASLLLIAYPLSSGPGVGREVVLTVPGDESPEALGQRLAGAGLISHPRIFALFVRARGGAASVVPGEHLLTDDLSPGGLFSRLARSFFVTRTRVTFPEGWTRYDIGARLQAKRICTARAFLAATEDQNLLRELKIDAPTAEGFMFPETYLLGQDADPRAVVRKFKAEFDKRYRALEADHLPELVELSQSLGWHQYQLITLASMVEKEAVVDDERPIISGVFFNRMRDPSFSPKLLQCDPTAGYGCVSMRDSIPSCWTYHGKITHDIVADAANPYNTYKHEGLPPGPICNPGAKSIAAAISPKQTPYYFFVAKGGGRHTFSETRAAHEAAIHH